MISYVLISYGPKPGPNIREHPGARQQLANLTAAATVFGTTLGKVTFDYSRQIDGLSALPNLTTLLKAAQAADAAVIIDDFRRIFARTPKKVRLSLWEELGEHSNHFLSLRTKCLLSELNKAQIFALMSAEAHGRYAFARMPTVLSEDGRKLQTAKAYQASLRVRSDAADQAANALSDFQSKLVRDGQTISYPQLASQANAAGLLTSRGGAWTSSSVHRALRRLGRISSKR